MTSIKASARQTGVLYLLVAILGPLGILFGPSHFIVPGDAAATAHNITTGERAYRMGVYSGLVTILAFMLVALNLYDLLKDVSRKQARLMVTFVVLGSAVAVANLLGAIAPLILLNGDTFWSAFTKPQLDALALGTLRVRSAGSHIITAFWGLWLLPFGILVIRSGFFPKLLGVLLILGCPAYLAVSFAGIVFPAHRHVVDQFAMPFYAIGEVSMIIWLLVKGAKAPEPDPRPVV